MIRQFWTMLGLMVASAWPAVASAQITWDGGAGAWEDAKWNTAKTAQQVFGRTNGLEVGSGELSTTASIVSGAVAYNADTLGDFRFRGTSTLDLTDAALNINSNTDANGSTTRFDGATLNFRAGALNRTHNGAAATSGVLVFGSENGAADQTTSVSLTNNSRITNDGQVWFGAWNGNKSGINVNMTIDEGALDLSGGEDFSFSEFGDADLIFINGLDAGSAPKNEKYSINFTGAGSIKVSAAGITNPVEIAPGDYGVSGTTKLSYQDLWSKGILQAHGFSGAKGVGGFGNFFDVAGNPGEDDYLLTSKVKDPTPIVWDGGNGNWESASWNSGKTAQDVFKRNNGLEIGSGEIGWVVNIPKGQVTYNPNNDGGFGDFRLKSGGTLNLWGGASLSMDTRTADDGYWTEYDGDELNLYNATFRRTFSGESAKSGGAFILGSWRSYKDQQISISLGGGARLENDGAVWFGAYGDNAPGLKVGVTINDGHLDFTGGNNYDFIGDGGESGGPGNADIVFINGWNGDTNAPKGEEYYLNFVGPGSVTVDEAGIINPTATGPDNDPANYGNTLVTKLSYLDMWNKGLLRANGLSGLTGADFAQYFSVTGSVGQDDYKLQSLLPAWIAGDINGDRRVNLVDFGVLRTNFSKQNLDRTEGDLDGDRDVDIADFGILRANFNRPGAVVPEPVVVGPALLGLAALAISRRRR